MFVDRNRREDRFLDWKVRLFSVAAVATVVGMALDERWMIAVAIALLAAAMLLRFLPGGDDVIDADADEEADGSTSPVPGTEE